MSRLREGPSACHDPGDCPPQKLSTNTSHLSMMLAERALHALALHARPARPATANGSPLIPPSELHASHVPIAGREMDTRKSNQPCRHPIPPSPPAPRLPYTVHPARCLLYLAACVEHRVLVLEPAGPEKRSRLLNPLAASIFPRPPGYRLPVRATKSRSGPAVAFFRLSTISTALQTTPPDLPML